MPQEKATDRKLKAVPKFVQNNGDIDVLDDVCPICFGTGMEIVPGKGARKCSCRETPGALTDPLTAANIPSKFINSNFQNYILSDPFKERALEKCFKFATKYPDVDKGLLLKGPVGVGKTHLAISILKLILENKKGSGIFCDFNSLLTEIKNSYDPKSETSELGVLSPILTADLLVLDEFAASVVTNWVRDTMTAIISARYNNGKITIITTNFLDRDELRAQFERHRKRKQKELGDASRDTLHEWERQASLEFEKLLAADTPLDERIGYRLRSRLYEMCEEVYIDGDDFRRQYRNGSSLGT